MLLFFCHSVMADVASYRQYGHRIYDVEHPLVYEDAWTKWPYAFINESGEPDGFNVELTKAILDRLKIPYKIYLCNQHKVYEDMKENHADLSVGVEAGYNSDYGQFGKAKICSFDNVMFVLKSDSTEKITLPELRSMEFAVRITSSAYHYLLDNGHSDSTMTVVDDMEAEVLKEASNNSQGAIWEQRLLNWIIRKYHLGDKYTTIPVDIPPVNYTFMSKDTTLLSRIDSVCLLMQEEGYIDKLHEKWMDGEKEKEDSFPYYILFSLLGILAAVALVAFFVRHYRKNYTVNTFRDICSQMQLVLGSNNIQVWVYYPLTRHYAWMRHDGTVSELYSSFEFSRFYPDKDFDVIHSQVSSFLTTDQEPVVRTLRSYDLNDSKRILDVEVHMEEMKDEYGKIYLICGVQHDITGSKAHIERMRLLRERYRIATEIAVGSILRFDGTGRMVGINQRGCQKIGIRDPKVIIQQGYNIKDFGIFQGMDLENGPREISFCSRINHGRMADYVPFANSEVFRPKAENYPGFDFSNKPAAMESNKKSYGYYYLRFLKSYDKDGNIIGYVVYLLDITSPTNRYLSLKRKKNHYDMLCQQNDILTKRTHYIFRSNSFWTLNYEVDTREITIYNTESQKSMTLPQLRILELIEEKDIKKIFRIFRKIESRDNSDLHTVITTTVKNSQKKNRSFSIHAHPLYDKTGRKKGYFGICRDITAQLFTEIQLAEATKKARETEHLKQIFLKNMSYSIRQPIVSIHQGIERYSQEDDVEKGHKLLRGIRGNIRRLTMLSDDTLLLSRIEAGIFKPDSKTVNLVPLIHNTVNEVLASFQSDTVAYSIENTYDTLFINIDPEIITRIVHEAVALSARYIHIGTMKVRYMHRKEMLSIVVEDNGNGIPPSVMDHLFESHIGDNYTTEEQHHVSGLEMAICKALIDLLGGTLDIDSEPGHGTSTYITIPLPE